MLNPIFLHYIFRPQKKSDMTIYPIGLPATAFFVSSSSRNIEPQNQFTANSQKTSVFIGNTEVIKRIEKNAGDPIKEIRALISLEINNIIDPSLQYGHFAWKNNMGDTFVSSSVLNGKKPDSQTNKLNEHNLSDLIRVVGILDCPGIYKNMTKSVFSPRRISFPMHYDLRAGNILVSQRRASILDFEYLDFYNLFSRKTQNKHCNFCNLSDIPSIPSNLRNMECRLLLPYLSTADKKEAQELFEKYLEMKSVYYENQSKNFSILAKNLPLTPTNLFRKKELKNIAERQKIHSEILKNPTDEIKYAEAVKIQIAGFIYILSTHYHAGVVEINPAQVKDYINSALYFFKEKEASSDGNLKAYFSDCYELVEKWSSVLSNMYSQPNYYDSARGHKLPVTEGFKHIEYTNIPQLTLDRLVSEE